MMEDAINGLLSNLSNELKSKFGNVNINTNGKEISILIPKEELIQKLKENLNESYRNFINIDIDNEGIHINIKLM